MTKCVASIQSFVLLQPSWEEVCGDSKVLKTLPKAQRTRGLSSYHKFKHKSWSNFIFRISTKHQLQLQPNISISTKSSIKLQNLDQISTKIQFHNLYKTSAEKNCPNSSFKSCLNFKILTKPCAQSISKSLTFFTKPQLRNLQQIVANKILISNGYNISKFWVGIFKRQGYINQVY